MVGLLVFTVIYWEISNVPLRLFKSTGFSFTSVQPDVSKLALEDEPEEKLIKMLQTPTTKIKSNAVVVIKLYNLST
jgi:hypothetical protein